MSVTLETHHEFIGHPYTPPNVQLGSLGQFCLMYSSTASLSLSLFAKHGLDPTSQSDAQKGPRLSLSGPTVNAHFDDVKIPAAERYGNVSAQEQRFWLKDVADANMPFMLLTLDMFHLISSRLKDVADANMPFMLLTLDMFHLISSPLNAYA